MTFWDRLWKDKDGRQAIVQMPNLPLIVWIVSRLASMLVHGRLHGILDATAFAALAIWAYLELFYGKSYLRRALGGIVLIWLLASK